MGALGRSLLRNEREYRSKSQQNRTKPETHDPSPPHSGISRLSANEMHTNQYDIISYLYPSPGPDYTAGHFFFQGPISGYFSANVQADCLIVIGV
jgi:hypothetical protein